MKRLLIAMAVLILIAVGLVATAAHFTAGKHANHTVAITASFYPMAEFARAVGGEYVSVATLVKPGVEPHDYDPTPQEVAAIHRSKLFIYNGAGLERWEPKLQPDLQANGIVTVEASKGIKLHTSDPNGTANESPTDPHVWMDPVLAQREVNAIRDGLVRADPAHRATYETNARAYNAKLHTLDTAFRQGLQQCQLRTIVTSHQAFGYVADEYHLTALGIAGLSPDEEPSPQKLAQTADFVRKHHVTYIFFETLVSPKLAQTIATETGAQTISFNPLEGLTDTELQQGKNYLTVQKDNLQALQTALHCQ